MSTRARIVAYGAGGLLVIAGAGCEAAIGGGTGEILAFALIGLGLVTMISLVFLEVGLSEDRELASGEEAVGNRRSRQPRRLASARLTRSRGQRRRLR